MQAITGTTVFDGESLLDDTAVLVDGDRIVDILAESELPADVPRSCLKGGTLAPGLIDLQVNGGGGVLINNGIDSEALQTVLRAHQLQGSTRLLATVISDDVDTIGNALQVIDDGLQNGMPGLLGAHLEGPFISSEKRGVHNESVLQILDRKSWTPYIDRQSCIKILTVAPECADPESIRALSESGMRVFLGHSAASYEQCLTALQHGASGFTHVFNAMGPLLGREPGIIGAALNSANSFCGVIADGHHLHPATLEIIIAAKPRGQVFLVSDAMATAGTGIREFSLYGEQVQSSGGRLISSEGKLAGSAICLIDAVRYTHRELKMSLQECLRMASLYPASVMGLEHTLGRIKPGYSANLIHIDDNLSVQGSWVDGVKVV